MLPIQRSAPLAVLSLLAFASAQSPGALPSPHTAGLLVPIHERPTDADGPYGCWAAGSDYKASFHDGFAFYPVLGRAAPRNLPLKLSLARATRGHRVHPLGTVIDGRNPSPRIYDYRRSGVTERYIISTDGVEQRFLIHQPLAGSGDLTLSIEVQSELRAPERGFQHAAIDFQDATDRVVVRYGAALVFDASGRRQNITTAVADHTIEVRIPSSFLADAAYPITVDPLISNQVVFQQNGMTTGEMSIACGDDANNPNQAFAFARASASSDYDVFVVRTDANFVNRRTIYSDLNSAWSSREPDICYAGGPRNWVTAFRRSLSTYSGIRVWQQRYSSTTLNDGTLISASGGGANIYQRRPSVGGTTGTGAGKALVAFYQFEDLGPGNPSPSDACFTILDTATKALTPTKLLAYNNGSTKYDRRHIDVAKSVDATNPWPIVFHQEARNTNQPLQTRLMRVQGTGGITPHYGVDSANARSLERPQVAGDNGKFYVALQTQNTPKAILSTAMHVYRFDWGPFQILPKLLVKRSIETSNFSSRNILHSLAFDHDTQSHAAIVFTRFTQQGSGVRFIQRLGYSGGAVESRFFQLPLNSNGHWLHPQVTFARRNRTPGFNFVYQGMDNKDTYLSGRLDYYAEAEARSFGTSCGTATAHAATPYAGTENYQIELRTAPANVPAILAIGGTPTNVDLQALGAPGCFLYTDLTFLIPAMTDGTGHAAIGFALHDYPVLTGSGYVQWGVFDAGANAMGLVTTNRLRIVVK